MRQWHRHFMAASQFRLLRCCVSPHLLPLPSRSKPRCSLISHALVNSPSLVVEYISARPQLRTFFAQGNELEALEAVELTEGKLNHVFRVSCNGRFMILKHAPPYAKCMGEALPLSQERLRIETEAMQLALHHAPDHVPTIYLYDPEQSVMAMEYLPPPHMKVMLGLHEHGLCYPHLAEHVSTLLAASLFYTSSHALSQADMADRVQRFANSVIVEANERVVLTEPLDPSCYANRQLLPAVQEHAHALRSDAEVLQDLQECVHSYCTSKEALIHNDLHTGNLLATSTSTFCIDWEFATMGPMGFDLGCFLGVLLLGYVVLCHQAETGSWDTSTKDAHDSPQYGDAGNRSLDPESSRQVTGHKRCDPSSGQQGGAAYDTNGCVSNRKQREWLLSTIAELWELLALKFEQHRIAATKAACSYCAVKSTNADAVESRHGQLPSPLSENVWLDTLGFAAFCMIRLTIGMHEYPGYRFLHGDVSRVNAEMDALQVGRMLLELRRGVLRGQSCNIKDVVVVVRSVVC